MEQKVVRIDMLNGDVWRVHVDKNVMLPDLLYSAVETLGFIMTDELVIGIDGISSMFVEEDNDDIEV